MAIDIDGHVTDGSDLSDQALANVYGIQTFDFSPSTINTTAGCLSNGDVWTAMIGYNGTDLSVQVQDGSMAPDAVIALYPIDLSSFLGTSTAYAGFTGGDASGYEQHSILNWQFADDTSLAPPSLPEPSSLALLGAGMFGIGFWRSRRKSCAPLRAQPLLSARCTGPTASRWTGAAMGGVACVRPTGSAAPRATGAASCPIQSAARCATRSMGRC